MTDSIRWQKSSFSGSGDGNACVEIGWQKSSFSGGGDGDDCVEVAALPGVIHLRESDNPARSLSTNPEGLRSLLGHIRVAHV
ncbi:DUF397 domain-containing protein [Streptomyces sp. NRRL F-525]|uniref:DUF397 domain-containing protein n=1 Tax=Streptomyces sp. NRRL F-525 TaxID=1463861 RepID=UPI00068DD08D|nr:DUF397 domain-containing protein [Streptomyces sp. NRRL F-525]